MRKHVVVVRKKMKHPQNKNVSKGCGKIFSNLLLSLLMEIGKALKPNCSFWA